RPRRPIHLQGNAWLRANRLRAGWVQWTAQAAFCPLFALPRAHLQLKIANQPRSLSVMIDSTRYPRLARINSPADLRTFAESELPDVARELREYLIESVASAGGHFGAGLGVVELTVALHYLYDT